MAVQNICTKRILLVLVNTIMYFFWPTNKHTIVKGRNTQGIYIPGHYADRKERTLTVLLSQTSFQVNMDITKRRVNATTLRRTKNVDYISRVKMWMKTGEKITFLSICGKSSTLTPAFYFWFCIYLSLHKTYWNINKKSTWEVF